MPGFLTHYIAGQAVFNSTNPEIHDIIKKSEKLYNLGAQGPDIFFYYLPGIIRKRSRNLGGEMHKNDLGLFIARMAHYAKNIAMPKCGKTDCLAAAKTKQELIFAYTAGLIMHYVVDVHAHPYVYAKVYKEGASDIKNSTDHRLFETAIDVAMLKLVSGKKPADYSQWELIRASRDQMRVAAKAMSHSLKLVYDRTVTTKEVVQAMRHMIQLTRVLRSRDGRRKKWAAIVEGLTIGEPLFSSLVHAQEMDNSTDYLNEKKEPWQAPWETATECTDSFIERFKSATEEGLDIINSLYQYVYGNLSLQELGNILGNRSLQTGCPCSMKVW